MPDRREILRFLVGGASTTLVSYALYLLLLLWLPYSVAYGIAYVLGIIWSYTVSALFVFKVNWSWSGLLRFPLVYVAQLLLGLIVVWTVVEILGLPAQIAPVAAIVASLPLTYLLGRRLVVGSTPPLKERA